MSIEKEYWRYAMSRQLSPFAALSGAEKQIRWLEYQSIKLPYVETTKELVKEKSVAKDASDLSEETKQNESSVYERPLPPPEILQAARHDFNRPRHTQYDAVIARMKQAELQSSYSISHSPQ